MQRSKSQRSKSQRSKSLGLTIALGLGALACEAPRKDDQVSAAATATPQPTPSASRPAERTPTAPPSIDVVIKDIDGRDFSLSSLRGKAVLVVNTASECGYTPQYAGLETLYKSYKDKGLVVIAVPSNDFGGQEPGTNEDIKDFTSEKFEITFPLMDKVHATGDEISPLFKALTESGPEPTRGPVKWNFTKFLLDGEGRLVDRFEPKIDPMSEGVRAAVERVLPKA